ncbi:hypothetical protein [Cytophaga hutchinsonii]|uniref:Uncharacterized protein n=1 Tax=Cytophaga hutchinsonii (strain ATCC 33406 / DSM 1761 / CIP 103989 / NBRC 15051 / NCIMB 9469 / D465) TaxID=269798 RepID=A0A6N4SQ74_CYTH3|nr:hypothetical protein [Cytophaga hutchinsonii]ABG58458.1 hypothetical protein CHU_1183 [Cytophaga hutchinsonii ATCC 33406]SFX74877.1 hypothetical protein SAMN04487930_10925 [Cytophaga hutchinsonii ATCC 33406]
MNYIKHLNKVFESIYYDERLTPSHVSLYMALFRQWNIHRFKNPLLYQRLEIMKGACIGSLTTYTKCLKELHEWKYINYKPSRNSNNSSISMYSFCTSVCTGASTDTCTETVHESVHVLYINNNKQNKHRGNENTSPTHNEVKEFFNEKEWPEQEADTFFFHYQATGWCTANQTKIQDWKAAAQKWMLKKVKFDTSESVNKSTHKNINEKLHTNTDRNYSEPL